MKEEALFQIYDWAPLSFIVRKSSFAEKKLLHSWQHWEELLKPTVQGKLALQDPRTSAPGMQFYLWFLSTHTQPEKKKEKTFALLPRLLNSMHSISNSWSLAYGLFEQKLAQGVFTYLTSLVALWQKEIKSSSSLSSPSSLSDLSDLSEKIQNSSYQSLIFQRGHPVQWEFMAIPSSCLNCDLARNFARFLWSEEAQKILMHKNFMMPLTKRLQEKDPFFSQLPILPLLTQEQVKPWLEKRSLLLKQWKKVR